MAGSAAPLSAAGEAGGRLPLSALAAGFLALAVAIGIGRFVYTPILPAMADGLGLTRAQTGLIGSANFAGYLAGALLVLLRPPGDRAGIAWGLALVLAGGAAMAGPPVLWLPARAGAGFGGALLFLTGCARAAAGLERSGHGRLAGYLFAGVGAGIALGGLLSLAVLPDWRLGWLAA